MQRFQVALLIFALCHVILIDQSEAMYGLCSTDWFGYRHCFDFGDGCQRRGGKCNYNNYGDHGEGCVCMKENPRAQAGEPKYIVLHEYHPQK